MKKIIFLLCIVLLSLFHKNSVAQITDPTTFFGFTPGEDKQLFTYEKLVAYLKHVDQASDRAKMINIGKSPEGRDMYTMFVSSSGNISNLDRLKEINKLLALDNILSTEKLDGLVEEGKVFVLATLSMHSNEVGPSQSLPQIVYSLTTTHNLDTLKWLDDAVYMVVPCHNPDGMNMIVSHYHKYKNTKYDGCRMPGLYHKYVGHDNNRDFVILSQDDTKAVARLYNKDWYPQILVEKHQMMMEGPRYFVPPMHDPIAENVDESVWHWTRILGSNMSKDMTAAGLAGVSQQNLFDDYWPGSTETALWKNTVGLLTEAASIKYASPVFLEKNELKVYGKGLSEYKKSINMPHPWPGGWWRLSDIVEYEIVSTYSLLKTAAQHKNEILKFRNDVCKKMVHKGKTEAPYYYIVSAEQHDRSELVALINLLDEHGIVVHKLMEDVHIKGILHKKDDYVISVAQPFRAFIKEVMEKQKFPERHYTPGGEMIKPYDITSWSLPLHRGIKSYEINDKIKLDAKLSKLNLPLQVKEKVLPNAGQMVVSANSNSAYQLAFKALKKGVKVYRTLEKHELNGKLMPAGSFVVDVDAKNKDVITEITNTLVIEPEFVDKSGDLKIKPIKLPRIALVESWFHDMDAGWTRFVLDSYGIPFTVVRPDKLEKTKLKDNYDVVIFPDENKNLLMEGKWKSKNGRYYFAGYHPDYNKGMGKAGLQNVLEFIENGGTVLSWGESTRLFTGNLTLEEEKGEKEEFQLPIRDISEDLKKAGFYCPGSFVKIELLPGSPLTYGMPESIGVFSRGRPVFKTSIPIFEMDRRVIASFPEDDALMSGYAKNIKKIGNTAAMVWVKKGKGQLVVYGFSPQFRASTPVSYKLLFNGLLM
ncbi:MAG: M14 family metallopeptidase [Bacteroidales bacterium]|nr:M14 family metallopeptidase [Bacteroidales bacterium]